MQVLSVCSGSFRNLGNNIPFVSLYVLNSHMHVLLSSVLSIGQWSERRCNRSESFSNTSVTVCECNHLTHFAILLSASPLNLTQEVTLSLEIIGYVGVSISLVAMALTIITFIVFKYAYAPAPYTIF